MYLLPAVSFYLRTVEAALLLTANPGQKYNVSRLLCVFVVNMEQLELICSATMRSTKHAILWIQLSVIRINTNCN